MATRKKELTRCRGALPTRVFAGVFNIRWLAIVGLWVLWFWFSGVSVVEAQTATVSGRVVDAQGIGVPGVAVAASPQASRRPFVEVSDQSGHYRLVVDEGSYTVTFSLINFEQQRFANVEVAEGDFRVIDVTLAVARLSEQVTIVASTPLLGNSVAEDRLAARVLVLTSDEIGARGNVSLADSLHGRFGSVSLEGTTTNLFQPTLHFRGFVASPLVGLPQGIAVYQNGTRINEPFGDTVQFDLLPQFAVERVELTAGASPAFGMNSLGGSLALQLKNGFNSTGFTGEFSGGSFGRYSATVEYGANNGPWALYVGANHLDEEGWRVASPSRVTQAFTDVAYREGRVDAGVSFTVADTRLTGNAPAPIELLAVDRNAVFTYPDTTENSLTFIQGRANVSLSSVWSVQTNAYFRGLERHTLNGDEADFEACENEEWSEDIPERTLCFAAGDDDDDEGYSDDDEEEENGGGLPLVDVKTGRFITSFDAGGDGAFNRSVTVSDGVGVSVQAQALNAFGTRENRFSVGVSADMADVEFANNSEVGTLTTNRTIKGSGLFAGLYGEAPDDLFNTDIKTESLAAGIYFHELLSLSERTDLTVSGRYNWFRIDIVDRLGDSLNGTHTFSRFNPAIGISFRANDDVSLYGRYSESNRMPVAAELSCADPSEPCRVPNAFISDPPLEQVIARSTEAGVRGQWDGMLGSGNWSVTGYQTRISNDIMFVASLELIGSGYFRNVAKTARSGFEAEMNGQAAQFGWYGSYSLVNATFVSPLVLPRESEVNNAATDEGLLAVQSGDRFPGIPRHSVRAGILQSITEAWEVALETSVSSSRIFVGDEGNDQIALNGYGILNVRSSYNFGGGVELFVRIDNVLDARYATAGVLAELEVDLHEVPDASDPRFLGPGAPRSGFAGIRVNF